MVLPSVAVSLRGLVHIAAAATHIQRPQNLTLIDYITNNLADACRQHR
jgi:hypothetical protein